MGNEYYHTTRYRLRGGRKRGFSSEAHTDAAARLFLGVRTPRLREIEKEFRGTEAAAEFLRALPHGYYDESLLHSIFISCMKDYGAVLEALDAFLPYVDNWAVCDALRPAVFKTRKDGLMDRVRGWIASDAVYTCRFGMGVLTAYYLDGDFSRSSSSCARGCIRTNTM